MKTKSSKFFFLICLFLYNNSVFAQQTKEDTFNLVLCEKTIKDNLIGAILLIDISDNDSIVDSKLLKGKSINLNKKEGVRLAINWQEKMELLY